MKRKLWVLNAVLIVAAAYAGVQIRNQVRTTRAREAANLQPAVKTQAPPPFVPQPVPPPVTPTNFADVAMRTLFDPSRDPNVRVEPPPPPPVKPMPELPVYHGQMNIGAGLTAILSVNATSQHEPVHPGGTIGQFKFLDVTRDEIVFEWEGKEVRRRLDEVTRRGETQVAQATEAPRSDNTPPAAPPPPVKAGPGEATAFGIRICRMDDGVAEGAVVEGHRKVVYHTPFGNSCGYEPVR